MKLANIVAKTRWSVLAGFVAVGAIAPVGCSATAEDAVAPDEGMSTDDITQVDHTKVKRQAIGTCWICASASWVEALNKRATGREANVSESYWTYWHWYEQPPLAQALDPSHRSSSFA